MGLNNPNSNPRDVAGDNMQINSIEKSKSIAIGRGATAYNYEVQMNLPPELVRQLLAASEQEKQEDFGVSELEHASWEPATVLIPAGSFLMGSVAEEGIPDWETPQFTMDLPAFRMGKYPVTNAQFARFVQETERFVPTEMGWQNGNQPTTDQFNQPVMGVTWYEALAYCVWLISETGRPYTLPSEAQWEKAAREPQGQPFPWGNDWQDGKHCNTDCSNVTSIDKFEGGMSYYGCFDMVGNVREWTSTQWGRHRRTALDSTSSYPWPLPWKHNEGADSLNANRQIRRVTRGGASLIPTMPLRAARRFSELPYRCGVTDNCVGFRVAINWEK